MTKAARPLEFARDHLVAEYDVALRAFLGGGGEAALCRAYDLGRDAVAGGVGVVEIVLLHHAALARVSPFLPNERHAQAAAFLAESVAPFEMTHRGFQEATARLGQLNITLQARNKALQESARSLRGANDAAELANRELEAFSYTVSHDLRAPLRAVKGFARWLLDTYKGRVDAQGQDWLGEILANADRMGDLIDGLLSLARITQDDLKPERVDLSALVREVAGRLVAAAPRRRVKLGVVDHLYAQVDPRLARSLFENLLGNAWKFTSKVSAALVEFGQTEKDGVQTFFVRDNGAGIDMAFAGKLFRPFQRLHTVEEFPGTGIGLATVQRIVVRHGGRIWAEGAVDRGITIFFTLSPPELARVVPPAPLGIS